MEKGVINRLLKQARLDVRMKQEEARQNVMTESVYSKMENGKKTVKFEEVIMILQNLGIPVDEFVVDYVQQEITETLRIRYKNLVLDMKNPDFEEKLCCLYEELAVKYPDMFSAERMIYFDIKTTFHQHFPTRIDPITHKELKDIANHIKKNKDTRLFYDDYRLIAHTIMDMESEDISEILDVIFPLDRTIEISLKKKETICNLFLNVFTPVLKRNDFELAEKIQEIERSHSYLYSDSYFFKLHLTYLENLYMFAKDRSTDAMQKVSSCLEIFKVVESKENVEAIEQEVLEVLLGPTDTPLSSNSVIIGTRV